jgi:hypothetical protein
MMINQIDQNIPFAGAKPDVIATHLKKFWTPQMRSDIYKEIQVRPEEFSADVREALAKLHSEAKA